MVKKNKAEAAEVRGIEETLRNLNIGDGLNADDAAQKAASEVREERELSSKEASIQIPPPKVSDTGDEDDLEEDGENEDAEAEGKGAPFPDDIPSLRPAFVPPPQTGGGGPRARAKDKPSIKGIAKSFADKLPGAEKIKVYSRDPMGKKWFIADYNPSDLQQFSDAEAFITRYVKPQYGPGEYDIVVVDAMGREAQAGQVRLIAPPAVGSSEASVMALVEKVMTEARERDKEYLQRMQSTPQQNPLELMAGLMNLKKQMDGESSGDAAAAMSALASSGDKTMQMMMMMMQMQQQASDRQMQLMMGLMNKPKEEDPILKALLAKLVEDKHDHGGGNLPPPPPPPANPTSGLAEILTAMAGFMAAVGGGGGGGGDEDFKEFLKTMFLKKQDESLGVRDVLALVQQAGGKTEGGADSFRASIDNIAALMNVAKNLQQSNDPGPGAGIFDVLAALVSNRDFAGGIAGAIRAKTDTAHTAEMQRIQVERQKLQMESRLIDQKKRQLGVIHAPPPVAETAPTSTPAPRSAPSAGRVAPVTHAVQKEAEAVVEAEERLPPLPVNTHEHLNGLLSAKNEAELVPRVIAMLIHFSEFEHWSTFAETLLGFIREGNKPEAANYMMAFFGGFADMGLMDVKNAQTIVVTLNKHFAVVQEQLADLPLKQDEEVTADALLAGAQSAAQEAAST